MSIEDYTKEKLWPILVETVHALVMYPHHKAYTREAVLNEKPDINPAQLAARLRIPLGEALVILYELINEKNMKKGASIEGAKE
ncbi:MAG: hypothetical protein QHH18_07200 [Candidatus Bathyarchaeota archaeon]|jgi:hypothetical protein|nr:hypothetical protein [Candidatus Bathyarchaeota archaeon A05DMB-5]MDH7558368.1 hypothetical protein [Candidatus Bathyarchaeota archaeon]